MQALILVIVAALAFVLNRIHPGADMGARLSVGFGFLVLAGYLSGEVLAKLSFPRVTGYLLAGLIFGPYGLGMLDVAVVHKLKLVDELALCLIAFTAGGELKLDRLKHNAAAIGSLAIAQLVAISVLMMTAFALLGRLAPFGAHMTTMQLLGIGAMMGLIGYVTSIASTMGVILETKASGPITDAELGTTIVKEIIAIVLFTIVLNLSRPLFGASHGSGSMWIMLAELVGSLTAGLVLGLLAFVYFEHVGKELVVFIFGFSFAIIITAHLLHFEILLVALVAGFVVANFSPHGKAFLESLEHASAPVFIVFFCIIGADLDLRSIGGIWYLAGTLVVLRAAGLWFGTKVGARIAQSPNQVATKGWMGFVGHAGLSFGLAAMLAKSFPSFGPHAMKLAVVWIVLDELIGPLALKRTLRATGEAIPTRVRQSQTHPVPD